MHGGRRRRRRCAGEGGWKGRRGDEVFVLASPVCWCPGCAKPDGLPVCLPEMPAARRARARSRIAGDESRLRLSGCHTCHGEGRREGVAGTSTTWKVFTPSSPSPPPSPAGPARRHASAVIAVGSKGIFVVSPRHCSLVGLLRLTLVNSLSGSAATSIIVIHLHLHYTRPGHIHLQRVLVLSRCTRLTATIYRRHEE